MAGGPDPFSIHCILAGRLIGFKVEVPMVSVIRVLLERLSAKVTNKIGLIFA